MTDSILDSLSSISDSFNKYIVSPANAFGLGGFVFDIEGSTTVQLQSEITDHYTEDNTAVQDQIAIKPKKFTLRNYVGELIYNRNPASDSSTQQLTNKLTILDNVLPELSAGASQAKNILDQVKSGSPDFGAVVSDASNIYKLTKDLVPPSTKQQAAYLYFKALQEKKILFAVQTPFEFVNNMAIESCIAVQDEETQTMSSFTLVLKAMRFASTQDVPVNQADYQGRAGIQAQGQTAQGIMAGLDPAKIQAGLTAAVSFLGSSGIITNPAATIGRTALGLYQLATPANISALISSPIFGGVKTTT